MEETKTVITGASGWLGRELIRILVEENKISPLNLHLIASTAKKFKINQNEFITKKYNDINESQEIENYFDFAFLTREKINTLGPKKYTEANIGIINNSVELVKNLKPKNVILSSSGAVYKIGKNWKQAGNSLYSDLKILQEAKLKEVCKEIGANLTTIRIFNLSGNGITKINDFAISQFISKALNNEKISIESNYLVNRSYCDISQLLNTFISATKSGYSGTVDSTGIKIELRDLAKLVIKELKSKSKFEAPEVIKGSLPDNYFSDSEDYSILIRKYCGERTFSIEEQIQKTMTSMIKTRITK
jgi:nucleoside-diphosphate-sugar epimerase